MKESREKRGAHAGAWGAVGDENHDVWDTRHLHRWRGTGSSRSSPPKGTLGYCTGAQEAVSTKRRKKFGSSVAYKTRGTFQSQR